MSPIVKSRMMEMYNKLFEVFGADDLILTSKKHLVGFLHQHYASYQQSKKKIWPTPLIFTLEHWLQLAWEKQLIQKSGCAYRLLNKQQEYVIWQSILEHSADSFLMQKAIVPMVQQAWQLCQHWQLDYETPHFEQSHESRTWKTWAEKFVTFSHDHTCIDLAAATTRLIEHFKTKTLMPPKRIFLIGFDEIYPQAKTLFQVLEQTGCTIVTFTAAYPRPFTARRLSLENTEVELQTMARWAYQRWQDRYESIACAIPKLLDMHSQVVDSLTEVFTSLQQDAPDTLPFNVAANKRFSEFPIIQIAFTILQLRIMHPFSTVSLLLRSPYLAYAEQEQSQRCQLDSYLRSHVEHLINLEQLVQISRTQHCMQLSELLHQLLPFSSEHLPARYPSDWAQHFTSKLQAAGWPGQRCLSSEELQLLERWSELFLEFSNLDFILGKINDVVAWDHLHALASTSLFQAKTAPYTSIHIVDLLDTTGLCFESLWVMGLDDRTWPAMAQANPFIPYSLQRAHQLPHSSNQQEFYFASRLTQRLLNSAQEVIFSHTSQLNEQTVRPSALITSIPHIESNALGLQPYQTLSTWIWKTRRWEYYLDEYAPPLKTHELASTGSQLFKRQAACPFQAFAYFRLDAKCHPCPQAGLSAIDRGILLHDVIANFWHTFRDQSTLLKQSVQSLQTIVQKSIDASMAKFSKQRPFTFQPRFMAIERKRLEQRLMKLIELDSQRLFFSKVTHEEKKNLIFGKLNVVLRIDRVDELHDGSTLIIDYKTGVFKKFNWFEERLDEPQLPLYCLSSPTTKGFAIIHIRSHTLEIQGLSEKENGLSKLLSLEQRSNLPNTWPDLLVYWEKSLAMLAHQFQTGFARVDPKYGSATCRLCRLHAFCRIGHHVQPD